MPKSTWCEHAVQLMGRLLKVGYTTEASWGIWSACLFLGSVRNGIVTQARAEIMPFLQLYVPRKTMFAARYFFTTIMTMGTAILRHFPPASRPVFPACLPGDVRQHADSASRKLFVMTVFGDSFCWLHYRGRGLLGCAWWLFTHYAERYCRAFHSKIV